MIASESRIVSRTISPFSSSTMSTSSGLAMRETSSTRSFESTGAYSWRRGEAVGESAVCECGGIGESTSAEAVGGWKEHSVW